VFEKPIPFKEEHDVSSQTPIPQPGGRKNPMLGVGLPRRDVTADNWIMLPAREAVNFTSAKPHLLKAGDSLYRVYGGSAGIIGGYWSPNPPAIDCTEAQWRSETAVELSWNAGTDVAKFTATTPLQVWRGGVVSQPAQDMSKNILSDYWLVGEGTQIWMNTQSGPISPQPKRVASTPWASTIYAQNDSVELVARPHELDPNDAHANQVRLVAQLAQSLQSIADALSQSSSEADLATAARLASTVANLNRLANSLIENLGGAPAILKTMVRAQVGLARHVHIEHTWQEAATLNQTLDAVVAGAAQLAGIAT
jgi:hypothetical protein